MNWIDRRNKSQDAKIGNTRKTCELGHSHRSKLEASVCQIIQLFQKSGETELLQIEDHVYLSKARIGYVVDFKCKQISTGDIYWIEAKGYPNDTWPIKKRLWKHYGPGPLHIYTGHHSNPKLDQIIIPEREEE